MTPEETQKYFRHVVVHTLGGMDYGDLRLVCEGLAVHYPGRAAVLKAIIVNILEDDSK
jgi:guanyl-specific ribonuclease Sa